LWFDPGRRALLKDPVDEVVQGDTPPGDGDRTDGEGKETRRIPREMTGRTKLPIPMPREFMATTSLSAERRLRAVRFAVRKEIGRVNQRVGGSVYRMIRAMLDAATPFVITRLESSRAFCMKRTRVKIPRERTKGGRISLRI